MNDNRYGLIGYPLKQSLSPAIHRHFDSQTHYELFPTKEIDLEGVLYELKRNHYNGVNVTTPHKKAIIPLMKGLDPLAERLEAVNTVLIAEDGFYGYNTDYSGFRESLPIDKLNDMDVMIFGAGGAARAVIAVLVDMNVSQIYLVNRNLDKAETLAIKFSNAETKIYAMPYNEKLRELSPHVIINATTADNPCHFSHLPQEKNLRLIYDLNYLRKDEFINLFPHRKDILRQDGLLMLVIQAAYARKIWGHSFPDIKRTEEYLRCTFA